MIDPLMLRVLSVGFALLFILAASKKLGDRKQFGLILAAYEILPASLVSMAVWLIPGIELLLGFSWMFIWHLELSALISAALLTIYALAIGVNLIRGRSDIDCGCSFSSTAGKQAGATGLQQISIWLVIRNLFLAVIALAGSLPVSARENGLLDYFNLLMVSIVLVLLYQALHQLLATQNVINSWRKPLIKNNKVVHNHD